MTLNADQLQLFWRIAATESDPSAAQTVPDWLEGSQLEAEAPEDKDAEHLPAPDWDIWRVAAAAVAALAFLAAKAPALFTISRSF